MKKIYLIVLMMGLILPLNANASWWDSDFWNNPVRMSEDNGAGNWGPTRVGHWNPRNPYHVGVVGGGHPRRGGAESFRFEKRPGQCGGEYGNEYVNGDCDPQHRSERTELIIGKDTGDKDRAGVNRWYAWSVYHKDYKFLDGVSPVHGQFKQDRSANCGNGPSISNACLIFFMMEKDKGMVASFDSFEGVRSETLIPASQISNKWHDIRVHAKWSAGADGLVQIWVDGKLKINRRGPNLRHTTDTISLRFGIYAPQVYRASNNHTQVVYYDEVTRGNTCQSVSQFMSCPGGGGTNPPTNNGGKNVDFVKYVNMWADLKMAYNRNSQGLSKAEWGKWHYCNHGKVEGRTGLTPAHCAGNISTTEPKINTTVDEVEEHRNDRFTSEITNGIKRFSKVAILNGNVFSFKDYHTFTAYETRKNRGLMLGFSKNTGIDGDVTAPIGVGWLFDNIAVMVANDNSMLGYKAEGIFDFKDPNTTYIDVGYRKKFSDTLILHNDIIYAFGRSNPGELVTMSNIHALGFESKLSYTPTDKHRFDFTFDMPLHVESGSSQFTVSQLGTLYDLNIDMVPDGRQMNFGMNHIYQLTKASNFITILSYINDVDHRRGTSGYLAMVKYNISF